MSALILTLIAAPRQAVDMSPVVPSRLAGLKTAEIAALPLRSGTRQISLGDLFTVEGDDPAELVVRNACDRLDNLGKGLEAGSLLVCGNAGAYLGMDMRGGRVRVRGNCGAFAATRMRGGIIEIDGDAGDFLGGTLPGDRLGLAGGTVVVRGSAGDRAGDRMRRGTLLIEGDVGNYCAARMLAGTIAVLGRVGDRPGVAMQRGTLLFARAPAALPATFGDCGSHELLFLKLMYDSWRQLGGLFAKSVFGPRVRRYVGDLASGGRGEILLKT